MKSLIEIRNKRGANNECWGTPEELRLNLR